MYIRDLWIFCLCVSKLFGLGKSFLRNRRGRFFGHCFSINLEGFDFKSVQKSFFLSPGLMSSIRFPILLVCFIEIWLPWTHAFPISSLGIKSLRLRLLQNSEIASRRFPFRVKLNPSNPERIAKVHRDQS